MDYSQHLMDLRRSYVALLPSQRFRIAMQRIESPDNSPNLIVSYVSGIEGLLRSLVVHKVVADQEQPIEDVYKQHKMATVENLYSKYLELNEIKSQSLVTDEVFELVVFAVKYRNLLAHECTYLRQGISSELIPACEEFLFALADSAGISLETLGE